MLANEVHLAGVIIAHVNAIHPSLPLKDVALENLPDCRVVDLSSHGISSGSKNLYARVSGPYCPVSSVTLARKMMYTSLIFGTLKME